MVGHNKRLTESVALTRWQRRVMLIFGAVAVIAVAATLIVSLHNTHPSGRNCIDVTFAGSIGANFIHACGNDARTRCSSAFGAGAPGGTVGPELRAACKRIGFAPATAAATP
jgi:hypothetical protein